jgi:pyridinium-3,5-bisthiocarboxylic acid mononucleotide nickel chelatase
MSRLLYLDCFSGISGDMVLGALIDAGLPLQDLTRALGSLAMAGCDVGATRVLRAGLSATRFVAHENHESPVASHHSAEHQAPGARAAQSTRHETAGTLHDLGHDHDHDHPVRHPGHEHPHRTLPEIFALIDRSALSQAGRDRAKGLFRRLAEAEAAIHQTPAEMVHLHEVGALDSIIDIVGAVFALEWLNADRIVCSPLNVGGGTVRSAHGEFPVPAPATVKLLGDAPIYGGTVQKELVTPTGALIATAYASSFGPVPAMAVEQVGYGAGERDNPDVPNVLRVLIGRASDGPGAERVAVIECEIDDMNPQLFGVAMDRLYAAGALEVFYVPVQMKKNRPGTLLTVLARPERRMALADVIFRETTTIGLRHHEVERECLRREILDVETPIGTVRFKLAWRNGRLVNAVPEFDDCARLATANNMSVKDVQAIAAQAYGAVQTRVS